MIGNSCPGPWKGIFFDLGGTLIFPDPGVIRKTSSRLFSIDRPHGAWLEAIHRATATMDQAMISTGEEPEDWWERYFSLLLDAAPLPRTISESESAAFREALAEHHRRENLWSWLAPGALNLLATLSERGFFLGVISNSDGRVEAQLQEMGLRHFFQIVLDSHVVGISKPDSAIFSLALKQAGMNAADALYIGDFIYFDGLGAQRAGLDALIIDPLALRTGATVPTVASLTAAGDFILSRQTAK